MKTQGQQPQQRSSRANGIGRRTGSPARAHRFALRAGALVVATIVVATACEVAAQPAPIFDHLNCYRIGFKDPVEVDARVLDPVTLTPAQAPPFDVEPGCRLQPTKNPRPTHLCVPTDKQPRFSAAGTQLAHDYLLYRLRCAGQPEIQNGVYDQYVRGAATIRRKATTRFLLVPAYQIETPGSYCGATAPYQCGGACPDVTESCLPGSDGACRCVASQPCGGDPIGGQCNGECAFPGDICAFHQGTCMCVR